MMSLNWCFNKDFDLKSYLQNHTSTIKLVDEIHKEAKDFENLILQLQSSISSNDAIKSFLGKALNKIAAGKLEHAFNMKRIKVRTVDGNKQVFLLCLQKHQNAVMLFGRPILVRNIGFSFDCYQLSCLHNENLVDIEELHPNDSRSDE